MKKKKAAKALTDPKAILEFAQLTSKKIAEIVGNFSKRTGNFIGVIDVNSQITPEGGDTAKIIQTVTIKYGLPQVAAQPTGQKIGAIERQPAPVTQEDE